MSLKICYLHSYLIFSPNNLGAVSDEYGERFLQDLSTLERWNASTLGDYCSSYFSVLFPYKIHFFSETIRASEKLREYSDSALKDESGSLTCK